jgi:hypothetical protein
MYLLAITISLIIAYFGLAVIFPLFFKSKLPTLNSRCFVSILFIFVLSVAGYQVAGSIADPELSNRVLHAFGGGFMASLVCFLAIQDTKLSLTKFQFLVITGLTVTTLGVANEILEFFLQNYAGFTFFSVTPNDTWYDLISNAIGTVVAIGMFIPFIKSRV